MATIKSIEEKAKAYDKAIERAKEMIKDMTNIGGVAKVDDIQYIFPELKESEDERIREALIENFKWFCGDYPETTKWGKDDNLLVKDIIAWFEKQGEHAKFRDSIQVGDKVTRNEDGVLVNLSQLNRVAKKDEKQGEKPRYSIGDVLCDKSCTTLNKDAQPNFEIVYIKNGLYICDKGYIPISQQDEYELVAKKIEHKPSWSEEDEKRLDDAIGAIDAADYYTYDDKQDIKNWLKLLKERVQPQPTWKPSDEQMEALEHFIVYHNGSTNYAKDLEELRLQLKKLRKG